MKSETLLIEFLHMFSQHILWLQRQSFADVYAKRYLEQLVNKSRELAKSLEHEEISK